MKGFTHLQARSRQLPSWSSQYANSWICCVGIRKGNVAVLNHSSKELE